MRYKYAMSLTSTDADFTYLFQSGVKAPLNLYRPAERVLTLANKGVRLEGLPICTWYYSYLEPTWRTFFRTYCSGIYAEDVYILTLSDSNVWVKARTLVYWMPEERFENDCSMGFTLTFKIKSATALT